MSIVPTHQFLVNSGDNVGVAHKVVDAHNKCSTLNMYLIHASEITVLMIPDQE